jgi:two-component system, OmpR family, alkaline phosphatase synthesis response regulator PhoP
MKKVLWYIDRDEQISEAIRSEKSELSENYEVVTINNPIVIDEKLKDQLPAVIFIDNSIADQDRGSILREFKAKDATKQIPIILTAMDFKIEDKARELGADHFLMKPFDMKSFFEKANEVLK